MLIAALTRCVPLLVLAAAVGCAPATPGPGAASAAPAVAPPDAGHLLIMGGAIKDENSLVYNRFFDLLERGGPGGAVGIIPTASGVEHPGDSTAQTLKAFADANGRAGHAITVIPIYKDNPEQARDPQIVEQIRGCRALWFVGGAQSRIVDVFRPGGIDTPAAAACREVLAKGGVIAGSSAGAAMMSDPMIRNGSSANAIRYGVITGSPNDEDDAKGVGIGPGMGFFPYGFTDQHFLQRGRLGRLIVALEHAGQPRGYGVAENSAMDVDLGAGTIEALGPASVVVVDCSHEERKGKDRLNIRLSLLSTGDRVDPRTGEVTARSRVRRQRITEWDARATEAPNPWGKNVITEMVHRLADGYPETAVAGDESVQIRIRSDAQSRFVVGAEDPDGVTAINMQMDLIIR